MLSQFDILVCGNSDPGTSGLLSPFAKIDGLYFDSSNEPDSFYYNIDQECRKKMEEKDIVYVTIDAEDSEDFYNRITELDKYLDENIHTYGTSREGEYDMYISELTDMDDTTKPTNTILRKKKTDPIKISG